MMIFIDTEFTDFINTWMISLGLVSENGEEFYVEVPKPEADCGVFERGAVTVYLGQEPHVSADRKLTQRQFSVSADNLCC
jgi:hypothetical protein